MAHDLTVEPSGGIVVSTGYTLAHLAAGIHHETTQANLSGEVGTLDFGGKAVLQYTLTGHLTGSFTFPPLNVPALTQNSTRSVIFVEFTQDGTGGWSTQLDTLFANATTRWGNPAADASPGGKTRVKIIVKRLAGVTAYHVEYAIPVHVHANLNLNTQNSLTGGGHLGASRTINLVNDSTSPGNNKYYGTSGSGVKGWRGISLGELDDVTITTPVIGHVPTWNGTIWVNAEPPAGGGGGVASEVVENVSALRALASPVDGAIVNVRGYAAAHDGGGGEFVWDADYPDLQAMNTVAVAAGGTGYAVGDILKVSGGTADTNIFGAAEVKVATLSGSAVATVTQLHIGRYTTTPGTTGVATTTFGAGTGATLNLTWQSWNGVADRVTKNAGGLGRWRRIRDQTGRISVKAFGAKGDNSTNDTAAILLAVRSGTPLFVPSGQYQCTTAITWHSDMAVDMEGIAKEGWGQSNIYLQADIANAEPFFHKYGRFMKADGTYIITPGWSVPDGNVAAKVVMRNLALTATFGDYGSCMEMVNSQHNLFDNVQFFCCFRGLTLGDSCFDNTVLHCNFSSLFYNRFSWTGTTGGESNKVLAKRAWGLSTGGHCNIFSSTFISNGTGIRISEANTTFLGSRMENNNYGIILASTAYKVPGPTAAVTSRSTIAGISLEASAIGILIEDATTVGMRDCGLQGSPSAGARPESEVGIWIQKMDIHTVIEDITSSGTFSNSAIINESRMPVQGCSGTGNVVSYGRMNSIFGATGGGRPGYRTVGYRTERGSLTAFTDLMQYGITGINMRDSLVKARNLGDVVTPSSGGTSVAVLFPTLIGSSTYAFNAITTPADGASTLAAGTYYYATTVVSKHGEAGINYSAPTEHAHRTVVVSSGQAVNMTFFGGTVAWLKRRIYRTRVGGPLGWFEGYWELTNTASSFTDNGTTAFTARGQPPTAGDIASAAEADTNYQIVATPSWATTVHVTSKATTGFTLNFGTPAPDGSQSVAWLMFRP